MTADEASPSPAPTPSPPELPQDPREPAIRTACNQLRNAIDDLERALLLSLSPAAPPTTVPLVRRDVMKPREYAEHMRVNVRKVHGWIRSGMPHFLVEGRIRIRVADADGWLQSRSEDPAAPAAARRLERPATQRKRSRSRAAKSTPDKQRTKEERAKSKVKRSRRT